jgi:hypothetical protein
MRGVMTSPASFSLSGCYCRSIEQNGVAVMHLRTAFRVGAGLTCLLAAATSGAAPPADLVSTRSSPEVMLSVSLPVGAGSRGTLPHLSLRFGQVRMAGDLASPAAGNPIRHRELLRLDVSGRHADPLDLQLAVGGRMTYDLPRREFGWRAQGWRPLPAEQAAGKVRKDRESGRR